MEAAQASLTVAGSDAKGPRRTAAEVQNLVADGDADGGLPRTGNTPKGRFWIGNARPGMIGRGYPASPLRIMRSIHGCIYRMGRPVKCFLSACHT